MKLLHTADLHLDSAFCGSGALAADIRRQAQRSLLKRIFDTAREETCDMVLIAGDLFDTLLVTPETKSLCIELFASFGRPVVIAPGNHDPYVDGSIYKSGELPENVYVFSSPELQVFDFSELGVSVAGYAFASSALMNNPLVTAQIDRGEVNPVLLLCAHTEINVPTSKYAPVTLGDIQRHGFTYAALGHTHNVPELTENVRYCGFPEGRGFDEIGDGHVLLVSIDNGELVSVEQRVISEVRYVWDTVSVEGIGDVEDALEVIKAQIKKRAGKTTHMRVEMFGTVSEGVDTEVIARADELSADVASLEIINSTLSLADGDYLEKDTTLRGEIYRTLRPMLISDDLSERKLAMRALRIGLAAIDGKSFTEGGGV